MPPFHWWRTVFFLIPAISLYTIVLGTASLASALVDRRGSFAHRCARAWSWLILRTTGVTVEASGVERIDRSRSYLFLSNHQSIYDIPVLFWHLPFELRIIAKESLGRFPFLGWHLRRTGHVLVDRENPGRSTLQQVTRLMRQHLSLLVFPEGTRSQDGRLLKFKAGTVLLALDAGIPIVPVAIEGTRHVMRKGRLMTCPGHVRLHVHPPIETAGRGRGDAREILAQVEAAIRGDVERWQQEADVA
jgi:1-acyl-sn-glycerol-3-phosphate acyltransferase